MSLMASRIAALVLAFLPIPFLTSVSRYDPEESIDEKLPMPDFYQRNPKLPDGGISHCGPTATSNVLVFLDTNGFPNMLKQEEPTSGDQLELINLLSSKEYMNTVYWGTVPNELMSGLEKYVKEKGYKIRIKWVGLDGDKYTVSTSPPTPVWLKREFQNSSHTILRLGYYQKFSDGNYYRAGGHYVTVVGFKSPNRIYVHDPGFDSGKEPKTELYKLVLYTKGNLKGWYGEEALKGKACYKLERIDTKGRDDYLTVLDGALAFKVE